MWLAAFFAAPEGVTVPLGARFGGGTATGLLLAAMTGGAAAGALAYTRLLGADRSVRYAAAAGCAACAVLVLFAVSPALAGALAILAVSGLRTGYLPAAAGAVFTAVPDQDRGKAGGVLGAGMALGQAVAIVAAGARGAAVRPAAGHRRVRRRRCRGGAGAGPRVAARMPGAVTPTAAQLSLLRWCEQFGHGWPPLRHANPGDRHWCWYCGSRRRVGADGTVWYEQEWD